MRMIAHLFTLAITLLQFQPVLANSNIGGSYCKNSQVGAVESWELIKIFQERTMYGRNLKGERWIEKLSKISNGEGKTTFWNGNGKKFGGKWKVTNSKLCFTYGTKTEWSCKQINKCSSGEVQFLISDGSGRLTSVIDNVAGYDGHSAPKEKNTTSDKANSKAAQGYSFSKDARQVKKAICKCAMLNCYADVEYRMKRGTSMYHDTLVDKSKYRFEIETKLNNLYLACQEYWKPSAPSKAVHSKFFSSHGDLLAEASYVVKFGRPNLSVKNHYEVSYKKAEARRAELALERKVKSESEQYKRDHAIELVPDLIAVAKNPYSIGGSIAVGIFNFVEMRSKNEVIVKDSNSSSTFLLSGIKDPSIYSESATYSIVFTVDDFVEIVSSDGPIRILKIEHRATDICNEKNCRNFLYNK